MPAQSLRKSTSPSLWEDRGLCRITITQGVRWFLRLGRPWRIHWALLFKDSQWGMDAHSSSIELDMRLVDQTQIVTESLLRNREDWQE